MSESCRMLRAALRCIVIFVFNINYEHGKHVKHSDMLIINARGKFILHYSLIAVF